MRGQLCLDYCNSLIYGLPQSLLSKVQSIQNAAARLLTGTRQGDHISLVLCQLHWLPVQRRVNFKPACFVYSSLSGQAPPYLADNIHLVSEGRRHQLRSSTDGSSVVPCTHNTYGDRSFAAAGPCVWNSLPVHLHDVDTSYNIFDFNSKRFGFNVASGAQCNILINCAVLTKLN